MSRFHNKNVTNSMNTAYAGHGHSDNDMETVEANEGIDNINYGAFDEQDQSNSIERNRHIESEYIHNIALFYLKMQVKYHLTNTAISVIIDNLSYFQMMQNIFFKENLRCRLELEGLDNDAINSISDDTFIKDLHALVHDKQDGILRSTYLRNKFYENKFPYVEPQTLILGRDKHNVEKSCQYIPIKETLKSLFLDKDARFQFENPEFFSGQDCPNTVYNDIRDGSVFQRISLLNNKTNLGIILYQDAFEIVNPLGSAKSKHKILAVYMTLTNLHSYNRSKIDTLQLVMLCKEADFTQEKVFQVIVDDIIDIETNGVDLGYDNVIKGTLVALLGDNLGSHSIGGFSEKFSTVQYFCRFCHCTLDSMREGNHDSRLRAESDYLESIKFLEENLDHVLHKGIRFNSIFNQISYFHVCNPGLPPCLGHDLFEGIVRYDLGLMIKDLVKKHWFSYKYLNWIMDKFRYKSYDEQDKPSHLKENSNKISGHAAQNWCLLRTLPLLLLNKTSDISKDDDTWHILLLLREMVEIICAPSIQQGQIGYLSVLIEEYLYLRKKCFQNDRIKPKHHYLTHYPYLITCFGPLIKVWTMRFESKHSFFKTSIRHTQNFINVVKSFAEKHQLLQAYCSEGSLFQSEISNFDQAIPFHIDLYNEDIASSILTCASLNLETKTSFISDTITYKGREYKKGLYLTLRRSSCNTLTFGKILSVLVSERIPYFVMKTFEGIWVENFDIHLWGDDVGLKPETINILINEDLNNWATLKLLTGSDIDQLKLTLGQKKLLTNAINIERNALGGSPRSDITTIPASDSSSGCSTNSDIEDWNDLIPWNKLPKKLVRSRKAGQRPDPADRREMVRIICDQIVDKLGKPKRSVMKQVSKAIVQEYQVLKDPFSNEIGGFEGLLIQLENRIANSVSRRRKSSEPEPEPTSISEDLLKQKMIRDGALVFDIVAEYPELKTFDGISSHFDRISRVPISEMTESLIARNKGHKIFTYMQSVKKTEKLKNWLKVINDEIERTRTTTPESEGIIFLLLSYFDEDVDQVVRFYELNDIEDDRNMPMTPFIAVLGDSIFETEDDNFKIIIEGKIM